VPTQREKAEQRGKLNGEEAQAAPGQAWSRAKRTSSKGKKQEKTRKWGDGEERRGQNMKARSEAEKQRFDEERGGEGIRKSARKTEKSRPEAGKGKASSSKKRKGVHVKVKGKGGQGKAGRECRRHAKPNKRRRAARSKGDRGHFARRRGEATASGRANANRRTEDGARRERRENQGVLRRNERSPGH